MGHGWWLPAVLVAVNAAALRVLELARLDKVFTIHETLVEGIRGGA